MNDAQHTVQFGGIGDREQAVIQGGVGGELLRDELERHGINPRY